MPEKKLLDKYFETFYVAAIVLLLKSSHYLCVCPSSRSRVGSALNRFKWGVVGLAEV